MSSILNNAIEILHALKRFEPELVRALELTEGTHTFDDVCRAVVSGEMDAHAFPNSILITEIMTYPQKTILNVFLAAGDLEEIVDAQKSYLIGEAVRHGASSLVFAGRRGWLKALKNEGWTSDLVMMTKDVNHGKITQNHFGTEDRSDAQEGSRGPIQ